MGLSERIAELQARNEMAARWRPVVDGAGIPTGNITPESLYFIAGKILHDKEISDLRMQTVFQIFDEEYPSVFHTDWQKLFAFLGVEGRVALRERLGRIL